MTENIGRNTGCNDISLNSFDSVLDLLRGRSCEERVAGLLISSKIFGKIKDTFRNENIEELLGKIVDAVSVQFILRMLSTSVDASDGQMKSAALYILHVAIEYESVASRFIPHAESIARELLVKEVLVLILSMLNSH